MADPEADLIRLSLPAEDALRPIVEVAVGVLARRCGLGEDEVVEARLATGAVFTDLVGGGGAGTVDVAVQVRPHHLDLRLARGTTERLLVRPLA